MLSWKKRQISCAIKEKRQIACAIPEERQAACVIKKKRQIGCSIAEKRHVVKKLCGTYKRINVLIWPTYFMMNA